MLYPIDTIRKDFPILHQNIQGHSLVYLDNAATTQKPKIVIDAISKYYEEYNANIHRGIHTLAEKATLAFEETRQSIQNFIHASSLEEIIFVKGTTEGINLVASSFGKKFIEQGDEIIISTLEHHSNIVPWQLLCEEKGAILRVIPIHETGELDYEAFEKLLNKKTKLVSIVHISNALGTINPIEKIITAAHQVGAKVFIDGAQSAAHIAIDVQKLDCDFYVFSGHKLYAPTGIGVLYGKKEILETMPPFLAGGEMIKEVSFEKTTFNVLPYKFEAGTPNIADTIALQYAIKYINTIGKSIIATHENELAKLASEGIAGIKGVKLVGTAKEKASIVSFVVEGIHHLDIGMMLDAYGIAVRTGHHCTQPLMKRLGITGTVRASFAMYNSKEEVEYFVKTLTKVLDKLR